ncbi:MAG: hypothetical protein MORG_02645 [Morganella sp. (in: enterobacteria)]
MYFVINTFYISHEDKLFNIFIIHAKTPVIKL